MFNIVGGGGIFSNPTEGGGRGRQAHLLSGVHKIVSPTFAAHCYLLQRVTGRTCGRHEMGSALFNGFKFGD